MGRQIGMLLGAGTPTAVIYAFGTAAFHEWAWRLPFLFGGILGAAAFVLRSRLPEPEDSPAVTPTHQTNSGISQPHPLISVFQDEASVVVKTIFYCMRYGILFYISLVYLPTWLSVHTPMSLHQALLIITLAMIPLTIAIPLVAMAGDKVFRRTHTLAIVYVLAALAAIPLFMWASSGNALQVGGVALAFALIAAFPLALTPAMLAEAFDRKHRLTGYSLSSNVGMALGGGTAPMIATWLIHVSGEILAPAYYLAFGALLATVALVASRDRSREPLR